MDAVVASPSLAQLSTLFFSGRNSTELENNSIICVIAIVFLLLYDILLHHTIDYGPLQKFHVINSNKLSALVF